MRMIQQHLYASLEDPLNNILCKTYRTTTWTKQKLITLKVNKSLLPDSIFIDIMQIGPVVHVGFYFVIVTSLTVIYIGEKGQGHVYTLVWYINWDFPHMIYVGFIKR